MTYLGLIIIPVFIAIAVALSPAARQEIVNITHSSINHTANVIEQIRKSPNITKNINGIQRQIAAYLLRQAAQNIDIK